MKRSRIFAMILGTLLFFFNQPAGHARPPKPGPNFIWIPSHTTPSGVFVPGHWKYVGPKIKGRVWVPGHYNRSGKWIPGHWKILSGRPRPGAVWVPGHFGPNGKWVPGHWR